MMPLCSWRGMFKQCEEVGLEKITIDIEFVHPYLCKKHFNHLLNKLGIKGQK